MILERGQSAIESVEAGQRQRVPVVLRPIEVAQGEQIRIHRRATRLPAPSPIQQLRVFLGE